MSSQSAGVQSIEALRTFREGVVLFGEDIRAGLTSAEMEAHRALNWLRDAMADWQAQLKRRTADLATAKAELFRKKLSSGGGGEAPDVGDKKEIVRRMERRVEEAERKIVAIKKWMPTLQHAIEEYHGRSRPLADVLDSTLPHSLALLGRMIDALDAYAAIAPPSASAREVAP